MSAHPVSTAEGPQMKIAGAERRRSERLPYIIEAWIASSRDAADRTEVVSVDLARHGVGFEMQQALPVGSWQVIEIGLGPQRLVSEIRVVSCHKTDDGNFRIGAEFC